MNIKLLNYNVDSSKLRIYYNTLFIGVILGRNVGRSVA